jgi:AcrR family transcriptional regulator
LAKGGDPVVVAAQGLGEDARPMAQSQKSVKKREAILHAAIKIINAKGFAAATMTEIGAAIDLRDAALYYYFPNKQALAFAGHQRSLERFEAILVKVEAGGGMGLCKLRRFLAALLVGMLIWLTKWTPTTPGLTNERLLEAIEITALQGLAKV